MQTGIMFAGDVEFVGFDCELSRFLSSFKSKWKNIHTGFTLNYAVLEKTANGPYWMTVLTNERVNPGEMAHFEVSFNNGATIFFIGFMDGVDSCDSTNYFGRGNNTRGKGLYFPGLSLYTDTTNDRYEFNFIRYKPRDKIGLFIDLRQVHNGRVFLTHNGRLAGLMFDRLQKYVVPGVSLSPNDFMPSVTKDCIQVTRLAQYPLGWNDTVLRLKPCKELEAEYRKGLGIPSQKQIRETPMQSIKRILGFKS
jgi:hypothetical protein